MLDKWKKLDKKQKAFWKHAFFFIFAFLFLETRTFYWYVLVYSCIQLIGHLFCILSNKAVEKLNVRISDVIEERIVLLEMIKKNLQIKRYLGASEYLVIRKFLDSKGEIDQKKKDIANISVDEMIDDITEEITILKNKLKVIK